MKNLKSAPLRLPRATRRRTGTQKRLGGASRCKRRAMVVAKLRTSAGAGKKCRHFSVAAGVLADYIQTDATRAKREATRRKRQPTKGKQQPATRRFSPRRKNAPPSFSRSPPRKEYSATVSTGNAHARKELPDGEEAQTAPPTYGRQGTTFSRRASPGRRISTPAASQ